MMCPESRSQQALLKILSKGGGFGIFLLADLICSRSGQKYYLVYVLSTSSVTRRGREGRGRGEVTSEKL